jgi:starch synthase
LLQSRRYKLHGILNGIDMDVWNPATDTHLPAHYSAEQIQPGKSRNKAALLQRFGVENPEPHLPFPLLGMVSRLVEQKGVDLIINAIPDLLATTDARFVLIGAGHSHFEQRLRELATLHPERVFVFIGYDEQLAHLLEAGADMFLMPSRFEPCGLNQMYSLRYGTPPIVLHTGGLADTVVDASQANLERGIADGFVFHEPITSVLKGTILRALDCFYQPRLWQQIQTTGMNHAFGWDNSAAEYLALYNKGATP